MTVTPQPERYNPGMASRPAVTVAAIVERSGSYLLVEERIRGALVLNQPAGHVEEGESLIEAVCRETREETAWQFTPTALVGLYLWRHAQSGRTTLRIAFAGEVSGHDARARLDRGIVRALWMSREQLAAESARARSPLVLQCIEDHARGRRLPLEALTHYDLSLPGNPAWPAANRA